MSSRHRGLSGFVVIATLAAATALASAQPSPPMRERHGLFAGGGLWGGNISCDGDSCGGFRKAGGASGHVGFLFTPRLGVLLDLWAMTSSESNVAITYVAATINARYWLAPVIWIEGGVGNGHAVISFGGLAARGDDVPVGQLAVGLEVVRGPSWAIDVQAKVAQGTSTKDAGNVTTGRAVGVGAAFTWYAGR